MKKVYFVTMCFIILLTFVGCNSTSSSNDTSSKNNASTTSLPNPTSDLDWFAMRKGEIAVTDKKGDVYFISHTAIRKITASDSKSTEVYGGFSFGKSIAIHNQWIYFIYETHLCRIDKSGNNFHQFDTSYLGSVSHLNIEDNMLYIMTYDENSKAKYNSASVRDDPTNLVWSEFTENIISKDLSDKLTTCEALVNQDASVKSPVRFFDASDTFIYFRTQDKKIGQFNIEENTFIISEIEPYQIEKFSIVNGSIYYIDNKGDVWRTTEDFKNAKKLV